MKSVAEWKDALRSALREAQRARDAHAAALFRETLAAIDNAEAPALPAAGGRVVPTGVFAGSAGPLGAGEVPRLALGPEDVRTIVERELSERRQAAAEYARLGRDEDARALTLQADRLAALLD